MRSLDVFFLAFCAYSLLFLFIFYRQYRESNRRIDQVSLHFTRALSTVLLQVNVIQTFRTIVDSIGHSKIDFSELPVDSYKRILTDMFIVEVRQLAEASDGLDDPHLLDNVDYLLNTPVYAQLVD